MNVEKRGEFFKVDDAAQIAYGWAIVCTENGEEYVDLQGDHIPEDVMVRAAADFAANSRVGKDMHSGDRVGSHLFTYPVTKASADLGITSIKTGLLVGFKPDDPAILDLIKQGKRTGFSIGGVVIESDDGVGKSIEKAADDEAPKARRVFREFRIDEISLVDVPAMEGAVVGYVKRAVAERTPPAKAHVAEVLAQIERVISLPGVSNAEAAELIAMREKAASARPAVRVVVENDSREVVAAIGAYEGRRVKSTRPTHVAHGVKTMTPEDATAEIESLKAKLAETEKRASLSDAERAAEIEKSNPVAYRGEVSGITVRKSEASDFAIKLAKAHEEQAVKLAEANKQAEIEKAAKETEVLKARVAKEIGHLPGSDETKAAVLKAVDGIPGAVEMLTGADAFAAARTEAAGIGGQEEPKADGPEAELKSLMAKCTTPEERLVVAKSARGRELYTQIELNKKTRKQG